MFLTALVARVSSTTQEGAHRVPSAPFSAVILLEVAAPFPGAEQTVEACLQLYRATLAEEREAGVPSEGSRRRGGDGGDGGDGESTDEDAEGASAAAPPGPREDRPAAGGGGGGGGGAALAELRDDFFRVVQEISNVRLP